MTELQILHGEAINLETEKKTEHEEKESCCCLFLGKIKNFWDWFYSGRIRVSIDLFLLMWEKLTFFYNCVDLLAMIVGGAIKFLVPSAVHDFVLSLAIPAMEIFIFLRFILPALVVLFYFVKWVSLIPRRQKIKQQIEKDDAAYEISLRNIYKHGFFLGYGIKFVWQNFKGRLFDFVVTSMFLLFMNLSGTWFVLYCIFVIWGAIGIIKSIIVARYDYCCLVNNKFKSECSKFMKSTVEYARYKHGQYFANYDDKPKQKTIDNENKEK